MLAQQLIEAHRWHELFEARLFEARLRLGIDIVHPPSLEDLEEPARTELERAYTEACREVGRHLADDGRLREAWHYLRAAGDKAWMKDYLATAIPRPPQVDPETHEEDDPGNIEELVEVALYEGVDPARGFTWLLEHYGTCNSVTTIEGLAHQMPPKDLAPCIAVLVRHMLAEVTANVAGHIAHHEGGDPPTGQTLDQMTAGRDWLFENEAVHTDASHLSATVRFARLLTDPELVAMAAQLAEYGTHLAPALHYGGEPPFDDLYVAHQLFFAATLGRDVDQAVTYFRQQAEKCDPYTEGLAPLETLLVLLDRVGRPGEALAAYQKLLPPEAHLSPFAPRPLDLAIRSGEWERYEQMLREQDDLVGLAVAAEMRRAGN